MKLWQIFTGEYCDYYWINSQGTMYRNNNSERLHLFAGDSIFIDMKIVFNWQFTLAKPLHLALLGEKDI